MLVVMVVMHSVNVYRGLPTTFTGSGTYPRYFRSSIESSHREHSLPGARVPGNFRSRERMYPVTFVPRKDIQGIELYREYRHGRAWRSEIGGCLKIRKSVLEILTVFHNWRYIRASLSNVKSMLILTISLLRHSILRN